MNEDSENPLDFLRIQVRHADGMENACPNSIVGCAIWAVTGEEPKWRGERNGFLPSSVLFNPLAIRPLDGVMSVISGEPAVVYKADGREIPMTVEELLRFIRHDLRPEEFRTLAVKYGIFHEIHEDFYDRQTGVAWQPILRDEAGELERGSFAP
ncbi:hypothetical protein G6L37_03450 [Agrobacterium rubi]|nr:hypothetical protein [Agrobacterium rubi]NTF24427.1 hypothetical protein [Agrobacterium rubi]